MASSFRSRTRDPFRIGPWHVAPEKNEITQDETTLSLSPVQMDLLRLLAAHAPEPVSRQAILVAFHEAGALTPATLPQQMHELAALLKQNVQQKALIAITKDGHYRLAPPVVFSDPVMDQMRKPTVISVGGRKRRFHKTSTDAPLPPSEHRGARSKWLPLVFFIAALAISGGAFWYVNQQQQQRRAQQSRPALTMPETVALVESVSFEGGAALSPDGATLAFSQSSPDSTAAHLFLQAGPNATPQPLTQAATHDVHPVWSPDGTQLAFLRYASAETASCDIYRIDVATGAEELVAACGRKPLADLAWSPDGGVLVFSEQPDLNTPSQLVALDLATGTRTILTDPPNRTMGDTTPSFSPDGRWIAFARHEHSVSADVFLVSATGATTRRLTHFRRPLFGLDWTPDGQSVIYASEPLSQAQLWRMPLDGGRARMIPTSQGADARYPHVARQAGTLVYQQHPKEIELWHAWLTSEATPPAPLLSGAVRDHQPLFAPTDDRVAFVSFRSGWSELWLLDPAADTPVALTHFSGRWVNVPQWSPDGTRLLISATGQGGYLLYLIDPRGGEPTLISLDDGSMRAPSWSHDGQWIYYGSNKGGTWEVWRRATNGEGVPQQMTRNGGRVAKEDPQGRWLYYTKTNETGLWRKPLPDGPEEQILDTLTPADLANWQLADTGIYFVQRLADGTSPVFFLDLATGQTTQRFTPPRPLPGSLPAFSVSADGQRVIFTQTLSQPGEIRLMEALP